MAQQQIAVQEQTIVNALGLSVTTMSTATQNFDGTVSRLMSFVSTLPGMGGAEILTNGNSGALLPLNAAAPAIVTPYGDAAGGQAGGGAGNVAGAVNSALQQPSTLLTQAGTSMQTAAAQTITSALGLQGVGGQFVSSVIPGMLQSAFASLFGAQATVGSAGATAAAATTSSLALGNAALMLTAAATSLMTAATMSSVKSMIPVPGFHNGGIAGGTPTFVKPMYYHGGGIAGQKSNEVLSMLEVGEEILTEDSPRHIKNFYSDRPSSTGSGGGSSFSTTNNENNITINIQGGGTPEQNDDLAMKTSKAVEKILNNKMRSTVDKKSRAGGMSVR